MSRVLILIVALLSASLAISEHADARRAEDAAKARNSDAAVGAAAAGVANFDAERPRDVVVAPRADRRRQTVMTTSMQTVYDIIITEIMYHNNVTYKGRVDAGNSYEYIEFKNVGKTDIELGGWTLSAVNYVFSRGERIAAGAYYVLARVPSAFMEFYGRAPSNTASSR